MSSALNQQLGTSEVIWNLDDLYESPDDPLIEDDIFYCKEEATLLRETFSGKLGSLESEVFTRTVRRLERIAAFMGRITTFAFLNFATRVNDPEAGAFLQKVKEISSRIAKETVFFELEWSQLAAEQAKPLLTAEKTAHFHHYLQNIRRYAEHMLSHAEESLLIEISPVGRSSWTNLFEKVMAHQRFGKEKRGQEEVLADLYSPDRKTRKQAAHDLTQGLKDQLHILSHIFNTLLGEKMIDDRLRSYPSWISSRNLDNELEDETVTTLIEATVSRYDIVQRYYQVKKSLLGLDELQDYDRYAPLANLPSELISWKKCREIILEGFHDFAPEMAEIADNFYEKQWIHAPLASGKRSGAFSHPGVPEVHPYVLVNHTGNLRDVSTVAHELGHGVHQYLAAQNGYFNSQTPLVLAETASVFAELLIFHNQLVTLTDPEQQRAFTCQKLESIFATVFRQVSMNRFENLIHTSRRKGGELAPEELTESWLTSQREMFGDSVTLTDDYGLWWSYIPHFLHTPGYVYSYAFGELLVLSLYNLYKKEGSEFVPKYLHLLGQGGSLSPYELLTPFGIDLNDPAFWQGGLTIIDDMLKNVE